MALCERETIMQEEFEMLMEGKELPPLTLEKEEKKEETAVAEEINEEKENISDENKNDKDNENNTDVQTFEIQ